jgi:hypothetical protein
LFCVLGVVVQTILDVYNIFYLYSIVIPYRSNDWSLTVFLIYLIYLYLFILFIIFHFKIVGSTPLIMHWYSSLDTLSSIEIITFLVQLLIWRLEENYIIQIISRLVGRTKKPKQTKTQKTQKTSTPTPPTPTKYHNIGTFPNWTGKNWKSSTIEWYHTTPNPSWFCKIK